MTQTLESRPGMSRLAITRTHNEIVHIGDDVSIQVNIVKGQPRLVIRAPRDVRIVRDELL
ncbi:carbon storage regulator [Vreelandella jeotgali]|uniref:carbon storage regulator n=1 Tax=Vreelandella jeotgali TaxID=553386 RepID=UPI00034B495F|nr:carbon storage regulator [Halomonas jeotgali]